MSELSYSDKIAALKAEQKRISEEIKKAKSEARQQRFDVVAIAQTLAPATQSILDAQKAYEEKGLIVEIKTDEKTGLIRVWKLKKRRRNNQAIGSPIKSASTIKQINPNEFQQILSRLPEVFGAKDIVNALIESGIGDRKLQPALGNILKGMFGDYGVEKVPGMDKGPSVRYRKLK